MRRAPLAAAMLLLLTACGDQGLLDGLGDRSRDAVYGDTSTSTTLIIVQEDEAPLGAVASVDVAWFNDTIADQKVGPDTYTIAAVFFRGGRERVVQASRAEVASALPSVAFPRLLPEQVGWVTSQLVFDVASGLLDTDTSAQFGLWLTEPVYPADPGAQLGVLRVGPVEDTDPRDRVIPEVVEQGLSLAWVEGVYRYELFCRATLAEELCWQMAENMESLSGTLPEV